MVPVFPKEEVGVSNRLRVSPLLGGAVAGKNVCFVNDYSFDVPGADARVG